MSWKTHWDIGDSFTAENIHSDGEEKGELALAGNRTRAFRVAGENSTTEPPVLLVLVIT